MSVQFFEKALASFKKANNERKLKLAQAAGYATADLYKGFLEGMIGSPSHTLSEMKKEPKPTKAKVVKKKVVPTIFVIDILDASVSMGSLLNKSSKISKADEGIKIGIADLKNSKIEANYHYGICIFSEPDMYQFEAPKKLDTFTRVPDYKMGGSTALYDAIGITLNKVLDMKNNVEHKDTKVLVNIYTDGIENDSREFRNPSKVKELIGKAEKNGFTVTFVGTDSDVKKVQENINIDASNTLVYDGSAKGLEKAMVQTSSARMDFMSAVSNGEEVTRGFYKTVNKK